MRNGINLFPKKSPNAASIKAHARVRLFASFIGVLLFLAFIGGIILQISAKQDLSKKTQEKESLLQYLLAHKNAEAKTIHFINKKNQLNRFLLDDAQFLPYYNLLNDSLNRSEEKPIIQAMTINKEKETTFSVLFSNYAEAYNFLKYLESKPFLQNFSELNLVSFASSDQKSNTQGYQLQFNGKFAAIQ